MGYSTKLFSIFFLLLFVISSSAQKVKLLKDPHVKKVDVTINGQFFTSFLYPDSLEKPVLYPVFAPNQIDVTRGFPLKPKPGDPKDHPHHVGIWFNFENVNGLDFWNNSYAIAKEKKSLYGWIKTNSTVTISNGTKGILKYDANWDNQKNETLLKEHTELVFQATKNCRIIDRSTTLTANTTVTFKDAKDGLLGMRLAHELQIPALTDQKFTDAKGNVTTVKGSIDKIANGNYLTSEGKQGDAAWSTRARWCKVYGKMGKDSVSVTIIDHPQNINYPTYWHARGYGLFAANPLGENIFTNGKSAKNLQLKKGESVTFKYRIVIDAGSNSISNVAIEQLANEFAKQ